MTNPQSQTHFLSTPFLGKPIEICIVTANIEETLTGLVKLGIGPFKIFHFSPQTVSGQTYRGSAAIFELQVAFATQGEMVWEVMMPISGPSVMRDFLSQTNGKGGIHHVAFDCGGGGGVGEKARLEATRRRHEFEKRGFELLQSGVWKGRSGTCEFMFFDTEGAVNTCFESYVFSDDWEEPAGEEFP